MPAAAGQGWSDSQLRLPTVLYRSSALLREQTVTHHYFGIFRFGTDGCYRRVVRSVRGIPGGRRPKCVIGTVTEIIEYNTLLSITLYDVGSRYSTVRERSPSS